MRFVKKHVFWKFFFSYFALALASIIVLGVMMRILLPGVFDNYLDTMSRLFMRHGMHEAGHMGMSGRGVRMMGWSALFSDLFVIFYQIIFEATLFAIIPSVLIALVLSALMSQKFVRPLQQMAYVADRVAAGHFEERLPQDDASPETQDELYQLADRFNRMTAQLEQVEDMRQKLVGDVAHELRTPLTVIKGSLEGLMDGVLVPGDNTYERIYRQVDRMDRLVDDLQELNRIEEHNIELKIASIDASQLLFNLVETMDVNFAVENVAINLKLPEEPLLVMADQDRLEQVLINLLTNALQATSNGGAVLIEGELLGDTVRISLADTGVGIPPEDLEKVFARFYRLDDARSRRSGGSGIGLTVAKKLVEAMGGCIWAESDGQNQGAVFRFTLPRG